MPKNTHRPASANTLFQYTIKEIHTALLESARDGKELATRLHTSDRITLPTHLGKFLFNGLPLTLERLSQLSIDDASTQIGEHYDVLLPERQPKARLYSKTYLHRVSCAVTSIRSAAILLGIRDHTLARRFSDMIYEVNGIQSEVTFDFFRTLSPEEVKAHCSDKMTVKEPNFNLPHERFNLTPDIPEDKTALLTIGNPLSSFFKILERADNSSSQAARRRNMKGQRALGPLTRSYPDILYSSSNEELISPINMASKKRKKIERYTTENATLNVGQLSGLSMFSPVKEYAFRIRKKRVDDSGFVYPELGSANRRAKPSLPITTDDNLLTLCDAITIHSQWHDLGDDSLFEDEGLQDVFSEEHSELDFEDDGQLLDAVDWRYDSLTMN